MILPGRLSRTTLGDVLGALHREQADGVLELIETGGANDRRHRVEFARGLVQGIESPLGAPRLGELLRSRGVLGADGVVEKLLGGSQGRIGRTLVSAALVSPEVVGVALRTQLRARLEALFQIPDAKVRFHVARNGALEGVRVVPLMSSEFLRGRPRFRDSSSSRAEPLDNLEPGATKPATRREQFRALAKELHPDRFPNATPEERETFAKRFSALSASYHQL
ncbi:MAG: J domain-containing protein [Polyangiaceae bacterium]|nr:J domain-containing protein [Polyangiaceae bacterium]